LGPGILHIYKASVRSNKKYKIGKIHNGIRYMVETWYS
jgi:hypothetical protein